MLAHGQVVQCDVGMCNDEMFLCQQSYGLIAEVQDAVEAAAATPRARWQRWLAYYRAALRHFREVPPRRLRVVVDGRVVAVDAALVIVANVKTYGAWLPLTPEASPVDGLFDIFVMRGATRRQVFAKLLRRHLRIPGTDAGSLLCRGQRRVGVRAGHEAGPSRGAAPPAARRGVAGHGRSPGAGPPAGERGSPGFRPGRVRRVTRRGPASAQPALDQRAACLRGLPRRRGSRARPRSRPLDGRAARG